MQLFDTFGDKPQCLSLGNQGRPAEGGNGFKKGGVVALSINTEYTPMRVIGVYECVDNRKIPSNDGQTTLEFTLCFVVLIILFLAGFLAFKWAGETITRRHQNFETGRVSPGRDLYTTPNMNLTVRINH